MRSNFEYGTIKPKLGILWKHLLSKHIFKFVLFLPIAALAILAIYNEKQHSIAREASTLENEIARKAIEEERRAQFLAERKAYDDYLLALADNGLPEAGAFCVSEISAKMKEVNSFSGWDFIDYDPHKFETLQTAVTMGLKFSAHGSETSGEMLVKSQIARFQEARDYLKIMRSFQFITFHTVDSFLGIKQVLKLHTCQMRGPNDVRVFEEDTIVL